MDSSSLTRIWFVISAALLFAVESKEYCGKVNGKGFYCEQGRCCGKYECCTYYRYYELWWFWLVWSLITLLGCCCAYHRRRYMGNYHGPVYPHLTATVAQPNPTEEINDGLAKYKLPSYAEVEAMPNLAPPDDFEGAPPPYTISSTLENSVPVPPYTLWHDNATFTVSNDVGLSQLPDEQQLQTTEETTAPN